MRGIEDFPDDFLNGANFSQRRHANSRGVDVRSAAAAVSRKGTLKQSYSEIEMTRFNPAPPDKYTDDVKASPCVARHPYDLESGLEDTFPASDAVSAAQPAQTSYDLPKDRPN